jgi:hypothetical protein
MGKELTFSMIVRLMKITYLKSTLLNKPIYEDRCRLAYRLARMLIEHSDHAANIDYAVNIINDDFLDAQTKLPADKLREFIRKFKKEYYHKRNIRHLRSVGTKKGRLYPLSKLRYVEFINSRDNEMLTEQDFNYQAILLAEGSEYSISPNITKPGLQIKLDDGKITLQRSWFVGI